MIRLQITDQASKRNLLQRADEILQAVGAEGFAYLSSTSPMGFDQRLGLLGKGLARLVGNRADGSLEDLMAARRELGDHELAARERRRLERVDMAIRLVRWLGQTADQPTAQPRSLTEAAEYQLAEGGFVDWARLTLRTGDAVRELSEAYAMLFARVTNLHEGTVTRICRALAHVDRIHLCSARSGSGRAVPGRGAGAAWPPRVRSS